MFQRLGDAGKPVDDLVGMLLEDHRVPTDHRPWVMVNMVTSLDGATAVHGGATGLSDSDDRALFNALRAVADVVLVGAGTARAEDYGPVRIPQAQRARRSRAGQSETPRLAVVTARLELDPAARLFAGSHSPSPVVFTCSSADSGRRKQLGEVAEVVELGETWVDLGLVLDWFAERGAGIILCEGGATTNGQLVGAGMVDEINLTLSPMLVSGDSPRVAHGPLPLAPLPFQLDRVGRGERMLFARYTLDPDPDPDPDRVSGD